MIVAPDSSRQFQTRRTNSSRPSSSRVRFMRPSMRSTTFCVAMPAWSVPQIQSALRPCIRAQADEHVLHRAVERVAHVQRPGDVRRRHRDHEGLAGIVRLGREGMALLPAREHRRLDGGGVVARLGLETGAGSGVHAPRILGPAPPALRADAAQGGDQLEEALGREVAPDAADARSQAVCEIAGEQVARHGVERAPALQEAPQRRQLGVP